MQILVGRDGKEDMGGKKEEKKDMERNTARCEISFTVYAYLYGVSRVQMTFFI